MSKVFLSIMDYYNGILFLTTNLVGALDEAFNSRIHFKINYRALTKKQTIEIWQNNIQRMRWLDEEQSKVENRMPLEIPEREIIKFAEAQFDELNHPRKTGGMSNSGWNGRQIRNACQIARSLAYADAAKEERIRGRRSVEDVPFPAPRLEVQHFRLIHSISDSFDKYMVQTRAGMTDSQVASENEVRADNYIDPWTAESAADDEDRGRRADGNYGLGIGQVRPYSNARSRSPPLFNNPVAHPNTHRGNINSGGGSGGSSYFHQESRPSVQNRQPQTLATASNTPTIMLSGMSSGGGGDYGDQQSVPRALSPRFSTNIFHTRGREFSSRHGEKDYDPEYRDNRNMYGKRERHSGDLDPTA